MQTAHAAPTPVYCDRSVEIRPQPAERTATDVEFVTDMAQQNAVLIRAQRRRNVHCNQNSIMTIINNVGLPIISLFRAYHRQEINPLKGSGIRWLHFEVFSAIQV